MWMLSNMQINKTCKDSWSHVLTRGCEVWTAVWVFLPSCALTYVQCSIHINKERHLHPVRNSGPAFTVWSRTRRHPSHHHEHTHTHAYTYSDPLTLQPSVATSPWKFNACFIVVSYLVNRQYYNYTVHKMHTHWTNRRAANVFVCPYIICDGRTTNFH